MSKLNFRVFLSVLISLGVILAIYTTVQGASLNADSARVGSHQVSGVMTNFNHDRLTVADQKVYQAELEAWNGSSSTDFGHDCGSQSLNPND